MRRLIVLMAVLAMPSLARADGPIFGDGSDEGWFLELNGWRPEPEQLSAGLGYAEAFGSKNMWALDVELDRHVVDLLGPLSLALAAGYGHGEGRGASLAGTGETEVFNSLNAVPVRVLAVYRFEWLDRSVGIPLVPFFKAGLGGTLWWINGGTGSVAALGEERAAGCQLGYELAAGLALDLSVLDRAIAGEAHREWGIRSTRLQVQYAKLTADDFGEASLNLSDTAIQVGLGFAF